MKKTILRIKGDRWCEMEVSLDGPRLSIVGAEGPVKRSVSRYDDVHKRKDGKVLVIESCGQITDTLREWFPDAAPFLGFHLNDTRPGCEHQRAEGWDKRPILADKPLDEYVEWEAMDGRKVRSWNMLTWATRKEHALGLLGEPCPVCGYKYGTAWLTEPLPKAVKDWFYSLESTES